MRRIQSMGTALFRGAFPQRSSEQSDTALLVVIKYPGVKCARILSRWLGSPKHWSFLLKLFFSESTTAPRWVLPYDISLGTRRRSLFLRYALQASALLQLSATAQQVESTVRFLQMNQQQQGPAQEACDLQLRLQNSLQLLQQLAAALCTYGEQNRMYSQQLQVTSGITSKVT